MARLDDIIANVSTFRTIFTVLEDRTIVVDRLTDLIRQVEVGGRQIHDANIVATMLTYGIGRLLTHNVADFRRFAALVTILPL